MAASMAELEAAAKAELLRGSAPAIPGGTPPSLSGWAPSRHSCSAPAAAVAMDYGKERARGLGGGERHDRAHCAARR